MFQDIRMPRRSLREVLPGHGHPAKPEKKASVPARTRRVSAGTGRWWIWSGLVLILVLGGGFFVSQTLATVQITVTPRQFDLAVNGNFKLPSEEVVLPAVKESLAVPAAAGTGKPAKASGTIVVSNKGLASQSLVVNTRFEAVGGKIYRANRAITIPAGKTTEVTVVADQAGSGYNLENGIFTVPGLKGNANYDKISAKTKTAISGGASGNEPTVSPAERTKAIAKLKDILQKRVAEQLRFQIPDNLILYDDAVVVKFAEAVGEVKNNEATLTLTAEAKALLFDRAKLSQEIGAKLLPDWKNGELKVVNLEQLKVVPTGEAVLITGQAKINAAVDEAALRARLAGLSQGEAEAEFKAFPAIAKAELRFQPPWIRAISDNPERIKVILADALDQK